MEESVVPSLHVVVLKFWYLPGSVQLSEDILPTGSRTLEHFTGNSLHVSYH